MHTHTQARGFAVKRGGTVQYLTELYSATVSKRFTLLFLEKKKKFQGGIGPAGGVLRNQLSATRLQLPGASTCVEAVFRRTTSQLNWGSSGICNPRWRSGW